MPPKRKRLPRESHVSSTVKSRKRIRAWKPTASSTAPSFAVSTNDAAATAASIDPTSSSSLPPRAQQFVTQTLGKLISTNTKHLSRALKRARGLEAQKLARKLKTLSSGSDVDAGKRCSAELEAARENPGEGAVRAWLVHIVEKKGGRRVKERVEWRGAVDAVGGDKEGEVDGEGENVKARQNVKGRLFKDKKVQECVERALKAVEDALGVAKETAGRNDTRKTETKEKEVPAVEEKEDGEGESLVSHISDEEEFHGFSDPEPDAESDDNAEDNEDGKDPWDYLDDPDVFAEFNQRLVGDSSDSEADDEEAGKNELERTDDEWSGGSDHELGISDDEKESNPKTQAKSSSSQPQKPTPSEQLEPSKPTKSDKPAPPASSQFLPTLMTGYVSGSSSDSDQPSKSRPRGPPEKKVRKNRMGQQARRALWEKKFGQKANHVTKEREQKKKEWEDRQVRKETKQKEWEERERRRREKGGGGVVGSGGSNEALHPSWEAARKRKEKELMLKEVMKKPVGQKITFD
ncbi:Bud-site selection protein [Ascodesmis nigricans]|uniref:Bud-site selection protein n=1 Tax=Ascodesmis nigricans TaxID=341454 RepID=A0A4S2N579_9PEZI|nr:Bud-site selection protein [Ascodesmis nigricans]